MPSDRASANRVFGYALLVSIVLHVFVLAAEWPHFSDALRYPVDVLAPLVARLVEPTPPPAIEEKPPPAPVSETKPEPRPKSSRPQAKVPPAPPVPQIEPERAAEAPPPVAAPAPAPAPSPVPPVAAAKPQPAPPAPDPSASLIAQYRAALLAEAGRHKRYPPQALDNGWEGEVVVRMAIRADGAIASLDVRSSSGHAVLDRQALEMFRKARAELAVPEGLRGRQFSMELRAIFNLKDRDAG